MTLPAEIVLLPDAGPLITLAYADALDVLFKPGWSVALVDMVLFEVTRNHTPTSEKLAQWALAHQLPILPTKIYERYSQALSSSASFIVPDNCRKVSTRAFLLFLEQKGWLASATDIERKAIQAGRAFSGLRFEGGEPM